MVTVTLNGRKNVLSLVIAPEVVNPADVEMLQDLVLAALTDAQAKVDEQLKGEADGLAGSLGGGFPFGAI